MDFAALAILGRPKSAPDSNNSELWESFPPFSLASSLGLLPSSSCPEETPADWIVTILIGLAGSFIGTYLGKALGLYSAGEPAGFIGSIVGAMILLLLYRLVVKRGT